MLAAMSLQIDFSSPTELFAVNAAIAMFMS